MSAFGALEEYPSDLCQFPLLADPIAYVPDTSNLHELKLQSYWIDIVDINLEHLVDIALKWDVQSKEAVSGRAKTFVKMYREHLKLLRKEPNAYGVLTVRR